MYLKTLFTLIFAGIASLTFSQHLDGVVYHLEEHQDGEGGRWSDDRVGGVALAGYLHVLT